MIKIITIHVIIAQAHPAIAAAIKAVIPPQMSLPTAKIKAQTKARIHHPIGKNRQITEPTNNTIKKFFISSSVYIYSAKKYF